MLSWITENLATVLISTALLAIVALIIISVVKNKRKGKSSCGCGCSSCPMSGACHRKD